MFHDASVALPIKPQETVSRIEVAICQSCPASRCIKSEEDEFTKPPQIPMSTWAFSSLNIKVLKVNPATLPAGQTSLWVSCPHRKEPLPLQNRGLFYSRNSARCTDTHPATHWNQRTMTGAIYIFKKKKLLFFFLSCLFAKRRMGGDRHFGSTFT